MTVLAFWIKINIFQIIEEISMFFVAPSHLLRSAGNLDLVSASSQYRNPNEMPPAARLVISTLCRRAGKPIGKTNPLSSTIRLPPFELFLFLKMRDGTISWLGVTVYNMYKFAM